MTVHINELQVHRQRYTWNDLQARCPIQEPIEERRAVSELPCGEQPPGDYHERDVRYGASGNPKAKEYKVDREHW